MKKLARELLAELKQGKLVLDWRKRQNTRDGENGPRLRCRRPFFLCPELQPVTTSEDSSPLRVAGITDHIPAP